MKLYLGIDKDNELIYLEWDKIDNEQRKTFSLCGGAYNSPITENKGEEEARERLKDSEYWKDMGLLGGDNKPNFLEDFIDFEAVAEHVLKNDGWENTNGEYSFFGELEGERIYLNFSSCGQHQVKIEDFKTLFVNAEDLKKVYELWDNEHLKKLKKSSVKVMDTFFEKYKNLCSDEEALKLYLNDEDISINR